MSGKTHSGSHHHLMECFLPPHLSQAEGGQSSWREVGEGGRLELRLEGVGDSSQKSSENFILREKWGHPI